MFVRITLGVLGATRLGPASGRGRTGVGEGTFPHGNDRAALGPCPGRLVDRMRVGARPTSASATGAWRTWIFTASPSADTVASDVEGEACPGGNGQEARLTARRDFRQITCGGNGNPGLPGYNLSAGRGCCIGTKTLSRIPGGRSLESPQQENSNDRKA